MPGAVGIAILAISGIAAHLALWGAATGYALDQRVVEGPLWIVLAVGGTLLIRDLLRKLFRGDWGADLLAGLSIITSLVLGEYLAGALVVLMLSGGEALEGYAVSRARSVLSALARRLPSIAHRSEGTHFVDVPLAEIRVGDSLIVLPHETAPVDGTVIEGHGSMDESYLTGEPYRVSKAPGATILSGAINGEAALTIEATRLPQDSRYARIMEVMRRAEHERPQVRRLGDRLGALYTPLAVAIGLAAFALSGDPRRFLAVLVVATPCPLLIAIPVAILGAISLAARHGIVIRDPGVLETLPTCRVAIFDKTGTLTYGRPQLAEVWTAPEVDRRELLQHAATLERYSKHPLASAVLEAAQRESLVLLEASQVSEPPGAGLRGTIATARWIITHRKQLQRDHSAILDQLPPQGDGMECILLRDDALVGVLRFRDEPRPESRSFVGHLARRHQLERVLIVSGDREREVRTLAERVGVHEVYAAQSPEQKLELVRSETARARTIFVGDGINDAPALAAASVGIALGTSNDVIGEAAGAVVLESSIARVDTLLHVGMRLRRILLQSAVGGMALSAVGMVIASLGYLPPVSGALVQEAIDVFAVLNALRAGRLPDGDHDFPHEASP